MTNVLNLLPHAVSQPDASLLYGHVSLNQPLPTSFTDSLHVVIPDLDVNSYVLPDFWTAQSLPTAGAPCVVFRDNRNALCALVWGGTIPNTSAWIAPTLFNSWTPRAGDPVGYLKDPLGFVHLRGRLTGGAVGTTAFVLPVGYRPGNTDDFYPAAGYNGTTAVAAFVDIFASGAVVPFYAAGATDVGLGGVTFLAEN